MKGEELGGRLATNPSAVSETGGRRPPTTTDIVIVAHNSGALLTEAVSSAVAQAGAGHVWVMDAESHDESVDALRAQVSGIHIESVPNSGFAASNNRMIEATDSQFVLLLNPDAVLLPGALETLEDAAEHNPRVGIVGALILNPDGSVQTGTSGRFPSLEEALRVKLARAGRRLLGGLAPPRKSPQCTTPVDWVSGAAMLVRRTAIEQVGPMDEAFFLYFEDTEWCHRMRDHGWEVLLEPKATVLHYLGQSDVPRDKIAYIYRTSFYRYCDLHGLRGLKVCARVAMRVRRLLGGNP